MWERILGWVLRHKRASISAIALLLVASIILSMCHYIAWSANQMEDLQQAQADNSTEASGQPEAEDTKDTAKAPDSTGTPEEPDSTETPEEPENTEKPDSAEKPNVENLGSQTGEPSADKDGNSQSDPQQPAENTPGYCTVTFQTMGGSEIGARRVLAGESISQLPTPYKEGYIFVGWCYDEACAALAGKDDKITKDLSLYASYSQEAELVPVHNVPFASATDVDGASFAITVVTTDTAMTAEQVKAAISAKNLTDPEQSGIITVTGGNGTFVITGRNPHAADTNLPAEAGFAAGATFRITLEDSRLNFKDQAASTREYNFTTQKEEVLNMALNQDMIFLPVERITNITNDGEHVETLRIAVYQSDGQGNLGPTDLTTGTFDYDGQLEVGDVVCIYAGLDPNLRTLDTPKEQNGDLGYVEITAKDGNHYTYKNAGAEQVIFEPDMLPIPTGADLDTSDATVTVEDRYLDYSADVYANIELDSQTTVDVGDFIMFYTGTFGVLEGSDAAALTGYGKITAVTKGTDGTTVITYTVADWNEVQAAMDIYNKERASGTELLENVDTEELESQIAQQAIDSGFAEEAAMYLASLALATDNFTTLSENMNLEDYKVTLSDGTPVSPEQLQLMDSSIRVEAEMDEDYPKVTIGVNPENLGDIAGTKADDRGLCIKLEISTTITISKSGSDNTIEIKVYGAFVEELGVDFGMSSKAIWKVWGIFPYIAEYRATINVDMLNYTGIEVNATMVTKEKDDDDEDDDDGKEKDDDGLGEVKDIAEEIKSLLEEAQGDEDEEEDDGEPYSNLTKRYSDMVQEESDWLKIVDKEIFSKEQSLPPALPIIAVEIQLDFVVQLDACVSVGFDMEYVTGKRYTYTIDIFEGAVKNDVITLREETFEFSFYALGRLAIRVGVELEFNVGIISTKIASVGFSAGAGAYAKLWGYFYYELKYAESSGWDQKYSGALLIEVGAYLEIGLNARAIGGVFSKEFEVLDKEWPLWSVGRVDSIQDFTTAQEDMPAVEMQQYIRSRVLPDSIFDLTYLDLKDGNVKNKVYEDYFDSSKPVSDKNRDNFDISFTNDKFAYDPQTNTVSVIPGSEDKILEGEMIITWINYPLAFSSKPIQRTITLYWSNVRDGYVIVPFTNGGSYVDIINCRYEAEVPVPADPTKPGYVFAGWYADEELTVPYVFPTLMPAEDAQIYAKWTPATDTPYTVEHYQEQLQSGEYKLAETERFTGTTDTVVTPGTKTYTGFVSPAKQEIRISADGSAVLRYYYALEWNTVTFDPGMVGGETVSYELKYGGKISAPVMAASGYLFAGWDKAVAPVMGTEDITYTAQWTKDPNTSYRVEYYVQQLDGRYTLQYCLRGADYTDTVFTAQQLRDRKLDNGVTADAALTVKNGIVFENMTVNGVVCESASVGANGKTVIKLNYKRLSNTLTLDHGYDGVKVESSLIYGQDFVLPKNLTREGYVFAGWTLDGTTVTAVGVMPAGDVTYTALWKPLDYTVHFAPGVTGAAGTMESQSFAYGKLQELSANRFTNPNYDFAGWATKPGGSVVYTDGQEVYNLTAEKNGEVTLYAVWTPHPFTITYQYCEDTQNGNPTSYTVESGAVELRAVARTGYIFAGWLDENGKIITQIPEGSSGDRVLTANWAPREDTAYTVCHYTETLEGGFVLVETEKLTGATDASVTPEVKTYPGFAAPEQKSLKITPDGQAKLEYYYSRSSYTITLDVSGGTLEQTAITASYEAPINLPVPVREGYGFDGWYTAAGEKFTLGTMPAGGTALVAHWVAGQYSYTVNHYWQNINGEGYTLSESENGTAAVDTAITPSLKNYTGFTAPAATQTITVGVDAAANVVNYYYARNQYELTWDLAGGTAEGYTSGMVYYGAPITAPVPVKEGYSYTWMNAPAAAMPAENISYQVSWILNSYEIVLNLNGGTVTEGSADTRTVPYGIPYGPLPTLTKTGYTFVGWCVDSGSELITAQSLMTIPRNHTLNAVFTADSYTITYANVDNAQNSNPGTYTVESTLVLKDASKPGYAFMGWYADEALTQKVTTITQGSMGAKTFYAAWEAGAYSVVFHSNNGKDETLEQSFAIDSIQSLQANTFRYEGYDFAGWATAPDGTVVYTDGQAVQNLATEGQANLYAVWKPHTYAISYENLHGTTCGNPTSFKLGDTVSLSAPTDRSGYTFGGWYKDSGLTEAVDTTITIAAAHDWILYAAWEPNPYSITFDSCLGKEVPTQTQMMEYGTAANLTLLSQLNGFAKPGYTFAGWSATEGGEAVYVDGELVKDLALGGNVTLYAVWKLNQFTVTYDLGAGGVSHSNPASYTIEDGDIAITAPKAKEGYQFLGWYTQSGTLVSEIVKGAQEDYALTAKWAHGGIFTLSYTSKTAANYGYKLTYTITRTLPEGTVATLAPQHVYYRTLNGTAYGGTVAYSTENDTCHFRHVGGPDVYATFESADLAKTFTVEEWGAVAAADMAASYSTAASLYRYFFVELYDVVDTTGTCQGALGDTVQSKYSIANAANLKINSDFYKWYSTRIVGDSSIKITDDGYENNNYQNVDPLALMNSVLSDAAEQYRNKTATHYGFYVTFDLKEDKDGYQWVKFTNSTGRKGSTLAEYRFATKDGEEASNWGRNLNLPHVGSGADGDILFKGGECKVSNSWSVIDGTTPYALISLTNKMSICFDASGKNGDDWRYRNLDVYLKIYDNDAPDVVCVAPMAFGTYTSGEEVYVTIVFDEVINSVSGVRMNAFSALPISDYVFVGGQGTNALTFKGTVTGDFEVTPNLNNVLFNLKPTVTGSISDFLGNK